jgi:hypothetical protein
LIDNMIIPNKNLRWDKVVNRQISVFGHIRVLEAKQTVGEIKSILNSLVIK